MIEIKVPSPGESITQVQIARWLVEDGEAVDKDQEIVEIDSDKATFPVAAPESGKITITIPEGETVDVGAVIATIAVGSGQLAVGQFVFNKAIVNKLSAESLCDAEKHWNFRNYLSILPVGTMYYSI